MVAPRIMLLQIFAAWPAPSAPAWITALAIGSRIGLARSNCSLVPPTIRARVPAAAAAMPPETGASTKSYPFAFMASPTSRAEATSIVEQSISSAPVLALGATSFSNTARTCFAAGSMVMTTSASLTASAAEDAEAQPATTALSTASGTRSNARTSCPALARLGAIPPPMWPRPMNAMRAMLTSLPIARPLVDEGGHAFLLVLGAEQAMEQSALEPDARAERKLERGVDHLLGRDGGERR